MAYAVTPGSRNWSLFLSSTRSDGAPGPFASLSPALRDQPDGSEAEPRANDLLAESTSEVVHLTTAYRRVTR